MYAILCHLRQRSWQKWCRFFLLLRGYIRFKLPTGILTDEAEGINGTSSNKITVVPVVTEHDLQRPNDQNVKSWYRLALNPKSTTRNGGFGIQAITRLHERGIAIVFRIFINSHGVVGLGQYQTRQFLIDW